VDSADASLDGGTLSNALDTTSPLASSSDARSLAFVMWGYSAAGRAASASALRTAAVFTMSLSKA